MYIVYMRQVVFGCPTLTLRPKTKYIYIQLFNYIYNMCVSHCKCQLYLHVKINITYINIYIYDLHGPRHIQKTGPKLIAIEPKLIAIPL